MTEIIDPVFTNLEIMGRVFVFELQEIPQDFSRNWRFS